MRSWSTRRWRKGSPRFSARCPPGPDAVCRYLLTRCNMHVWQCDDSRPVPGLVPAEVKGPQPGRGELLIRVQAVGVTHTEMLWQPTTHTQSGDNRRHAIPGHE